MDTRAAPVVLGAVALAILGAQSANATRPAYPDPAQVRVSVEPFVDGLDDPIALAAPQDGSGRMFVLERAGRIRVIKAGAVVEKPFLDITDRVDAGAPARGLVGLAFHPRYAQNGAFFVTYTARQPAGQVTVARFTASSDPDLAEATSEKPVLSWPHPRDNDIGGDLKFGLDGTLYVATGDGGGTGDPDGTAQNPDSLMGKLLRLDIDGAPPYQVPSDNPFVGQPGHRPEVWAFGLRDPWRFAIDRENGDLYVGDRGQSKYDELDFQANDSHGGEDYGWNIMEGSHCYEDPFCDMNDRIVPIAEYRHVGQCVAITGGAVYRGQRYPDMLGMYLYGDSCLDVIVGSSRNADGNWITGQVGMIGGLGLTSIGEAADGELYAVGHSGRVMHIVSDGSGPTPTVRPPTKTPVPATTTPVGATQTPIGLTPTPHPTTPAPLTEPPPSPTLDGHRVEVTAADFSFVPATIRAAEGEVLVIRLTNAGQRMHDITFELDESRIETSARIGPGQSIEIDFYGPRTPGRYVYYCSVGDHRARGMHGTLVVGSGPCPGGCPAYLPYSVK